MKKPLITRSKEVMGGTPVFAGTRVPVVALFDYLEGGQTVGEFLDDFRSVNRSKAIDVIRMLSKKLLDGAKSSL